MSFGDDDDADDEPAVSLSVPKVQSDPHNLSPPVRDDDIECLTL